MTKDFSLGTLFLIAGSILLLSAAIDRTPPVVVSAIHAVGSVEPGQEIPIRVQLTRLRHCLTSVQMTVFDAKHTRFPAANEYYDIVGPLGSDDYINRVPIDADAVPGEGKIRYGLKWVCNYTHLLWPITEYYDVNIEIMPKEGSVQ